MGRSSRTLQPNSALPEIAIWLWLVGPTTVLVLSLLLQPGEGRLVRLPWTGTRLPETCFFYSLFQTNCPGCGLTRSFLQLAHGNLHTAFRLNPVGPMLYTYVALQIPQALLRFLSDHRRQSWIGDEHLKKWTSVNEWTLIVLLVTLVIQWVWRFYFGE